MTLDQYINMKQEDVYKLLVGSVIVELNDHRVKIVKVMQGYYSVRIDLGSIGQFEYFVQILPNEKNCEMGILKYYKGVNKMEIGCSIFKLNMENFKE